MELSKVKAVLVDIEGTTTSISFVKETLFPFVKKNLTEYVEKHWEKDEFKQDLKILKEQSEADEKATVEGLVPITDDSKDSLVKNVFWQMDLDRKTSGLKQLQGHVWREGYTSGDLKGHVYPEVAEALKAWQKAGKRLYVYSSGSVEAQKLLFGHSIAGDLAELFSGFFDTAVGAKIAKDSYVAIAKDVGLDSDEILFLTDVVKEAEAARDAGLQVAIVVREGNTPLDDESKKAYTVIQTLEEIVFEPSSKRAKLADEKTEEKKTSEEAKPENGEKMEIDAKAEVEAPASEPIVESQKIETPEEKKIEAEPEKMSVAEEKPAEKVEEDVKAELKPTNGEEQQDKPEEAEKPKEALPESGEKAEDVKSTNSEGKPEEVKVQNGAEKLEKVEVANEEKKEEVKSTNGEKKEEEKEKSTNGEKKEEEKSTNGEKKEEEKSTSGEEKKEEKSTNGEEKKEEKSTNGEEKKEEKSTNGEEKKEVENGTAMDVDESNGQNGKPVVAKTVPVVTKEVEIDGAVDAEPVVAKAVVVESSVPIEVAAE